MKYRKKPLVVEAQQYLADPHELGTEDSCLICSVVREMGDYAPYVRALDGRAIPVHFNDWIVRSPSGDVWPVAPETFAATYEPVEEPHD